MRIDLSTEGSPCPPTLVYSTMLCKPERLVQAPARISARLHHRSRHATILAVADRPTTALFDFPCLDSWPQPRPTSRVVSREQDASPADESLRSHPGLRPSTRRLSSPLDGPTSHAPASPALIQPTSPNGTDPVISVRPSKP
jgi:hypothetical protein